MLVDLCSLCFCSAISSPIWTALLSPLNPVGATNVKHEMHTRRRCYTQPIKLEISSVLPALHGDTCCAFTLAIKIHSRPGSALLCENHLPHLWSGGFLRELCFGILVGSHCWKASRLLQSVQCVSRHRSSVVTHSLSVQALPMKGGAC